MEQSGIFREKSIQRVTAPEQLNDYIKVTSPSVWMLLAAVLLLLIGITVWGVFGQLETAVNAAGVSQGGKLLVFVPEADADKIQEGQRVIIDNQEAQFTMASAQPMPASACLDAYGLHCLNMTGDEWVVPLEVDLDLPEGTYSARIIVDSVNPISFVIG